MAFLGPHLALCVQQQEAAAAYILAWPNHCRACHGWGATGGGTDPDSGYADSDPCERCTEQGICPRCGAKALDEEGVTCGACWFNAKTDEGCPDVDCGCFASLEEEWEERQAAENYADMVEWLCGSAPAPYDYAADDFAYQVFKETGRRV